MRHFTLLSTRWATLVAATGAALLLASPAQALTVDARPDSSATFNGTVRAIVYAGNAAYIGGDFTIAYAGGAKVNRAYLAAVNASTGELLAWSPKADGKVRGLAVSGSTVYAVGDFSTINGERHHHVVALDGSTGTPRPGFDGKVEGLVNAVGVGNGRVYVAGAITAINGVPRAGAGALDLDNGDTDPAWAPALGEGTAEALAVSGSRVYLGGTFRNINGVAGSGKLAAVNATSAAVDPGFDPPVAVLAHAIAVNGSTVYAALGGQGGRAVAYTTSGVLRWTVTADGDVQAVGAIGDKVVLGGHFDRVCRSTRVGDHGVCLDGHDERVKMAAVDTEGQLQPWAPHGNGISGVYAVGIGAAADKVAVGGAFTTINGLTHRRFAQFTLT